MPIIGGRQVGVRGLGFQGAGKPNAPTGVTATDVGTGRAYNNGAATVSFTPGSSNGAPITQYTVTSSPGGYTNTGVSSPITVTGLQSNTSYTFTVTATNAVGTSDSSSASSPITATTVPQAPTIGTATDGGTGSTVSVAFTPGATGGKAVSTYTATSSPESITNTGGSSPITISGLTADTAYTFTVTATNANGTSTASSASNSVTPIVPGAFESIASFAANGSSGTYTFSSIPSTYKHLQIRAFIVGGSAIGSTNLDMRLNGDTAGNYNIHYIASSTSTGGAANNVRIEQIILLGSSTDRNASVITDIYDYSSTSKYKTIKSFAGSDNNGAGELTVSSASWMNTSAINSIQVYTDNGGAFPNGSVISLYGVKG